MDKEETSLNGTDNLNNGIRRRKKPKTLISHAFHEFAKNTAVHGVHYFVKKTFSTAEKLFWIITFTISIILCSILIKNVYVKWKTSPAIVTVSERLVSVGEIPFPSVTICPQIKAKATVYSFTNEYDKIKTNKTVSKMDLDKFSDVSVLCGLYNNFELSDTRMKTDSSFIDVIDAVALNESDLFFDCVYKDKNIPCGSLFKKVYTAEGLCYNMNGLAASEMFQNTVQTDYVYSERNKVTKGWSLDKGYSGAEKDAFPLQGRENGPTPDLQVVLAYDEDDADGLCNGLNSGFKIYMHHPTDHPQSSLYYYAALDGQVSSMAVVADIMTSESSLERYSVDTRQCYFQNERQLHYFKTYTASNCRLECLSNYTYQECGCVGYYMPHDNSSEICADGKQKCMESALIDLAERELQFKLNKSDGGCQCLAECNSVEYSAEILKTNFNFNSFLKSFASTEDKAFGSLFDINTQKYSKIEMYFKKPQFLSMKRSELFGITDFLANIGGLLGLFCGFSCLSIIELIYFFTIRIGCILRRDRIKKNVAI